MNLDTEIASNIQQKDQDDALIELYAIEKRIVSLLEIASRTIAALGSDDKTDTRKRQVETGISQYFTVLNDVQESLRAMVRRMVTEKAVLAGKEQSVVRLNSYGDEADYQLNLRKYRLMYEKLKNRETTREMPEG